MNDNELKFGDMFETFKPTMLDAKGRVVGYVVGLREVVDTGECFAWVQKSIKTADGWKDFGRSQPSKRFPNFAQASAWAYSTANERASKLSRISSR